MSNTDLIDKKQVLRYLGYGNEVCDEATDAFINKATEMVLGCGQARIVHVLKQKSELEKTGLLCGKDIYTHLEGCDSVILLAATMGSEIEQKIRTAQATDALMPVVLDACATVYIETACDNYCKELAESLIKEKLYITERFSPGYGDFLLDVQGGLLKAVDAQRRIGLCVTEQNILTPRKSVTALIGVADVPVKGKLAGCGRCVLRDKCQFRKKGESCNV